VESDEVNTFHVEPPISMQFVGKMDDRWRTSVATIRRRDQGDRSADKIRRRNLALMLGLVIILLLPEQGPCRVNPVQSIRYTDNVRSAWWSSGSTALDALKIGHQSCISQNGPTLQRNSRGPPAQRASSIESSTFWCLQVIRF
jgi:hypothetical protein